VLAKELERNLEVVSVAEILTISSAATHPQGTVTCNTPPHALVAVTPLHTKSITEKEGIILTHSSLADIAVHPGTVTVTKVPTEVVVTPDHTKLKLVGFVVERTHSSRTLITLFLLELSVET
jgi:hypothetical protein